MELRPTNKNDEKKLVEIYENFYAHEFPLNFSNTFAHVLAEDDEILGFGWLDLMVESNVILNLNAKQRNKFEALRKIIEYGTQVANKAGFNQIHAFPKDVRFSNILEKHLKFKRITSECLVKNLGDSNG